MGLAVSRGLAPNSRLSLVRTGRITATVHHVSGGLVMQLCLVSTGRVLGPARHMSGE